MPSANDLFANAVVITGASGSVSGNNATDTTEAGEPVPIDTIQYDGWAGRTVWYTWVPPADALVSMGVVSAVDTVMAVYVGSTLATLHEVASNDETAASGRSSSLTFAASAGVTYRIQVGVFADASSTAAGGAFSLEWAPLAVSLVDISGAVGSVSGTTSSAPNNTVWYRLPTPSTGLIEAHLFGVPFGTATELSAYAGRGSAENKGVEEAGAWPAKAAVEASAGAYCYLAVRIPSGAAFTMRWATSHSQTLDWYSPAAYFTRTSESDTGLAPPARPRLAALPAPTAKLTLHTPDAPALTKTTLPGGYLMCFPGATYWYIQPKDSGQAPSLSDLLRGEINDPLGHITNGMPYRDPSLAPPALVGEYLSPGMFSVAGYCRPVFGVGRDAQVAFEVALEMTHEGQTVPYPSPVLAALSGFAMEPYSPGAHTAAGQALHGFVPVAAVAPYAPEDLVFGVASVRTAFDARTDTVYVGGVAARTGAVVTDASDALSVRLTVVGANLAEVTAVSVKGFGAGSTSTAQTHGVSGGLAGLKYVYQAQVTASVDYLVGSQMTMLAQPYWLGPEPSEFWTAFINSAETLRITE